MRVRIVGKEIARVCFLFIHAAAVQRHQRVAMCINDKKIFTLSCHGWFLFCSM